MTSEYAEFVAHCGMMLGNRQLDHLVYAVNDLEEACKAFAKTTGVEPTYGGTHPGRGTHNALVNLGGGAYFELIAPDPKKTFSGDLRWMGVDLVKTPRITRWAIKSADLEIDIEHIGRTYPALSSISTGNRKTTDGDLLSWSMIEPAPRPAIEVVPFAIDWSKSGLIPTDSLPAAKVELSGLAVTTSSFSTIQKLYSDLGVQVDIRVGQPQLQVELDTPKGKIILV